MTVPKIPKIEMAQVHIRLAQEDDTLDAAALRDRTVAAVGGVAYCVPIPHRSNRVGK